MNTEKIWFVVSDIHSFYIELKDALWQAGFRKTNKNHYLVVLGDLFDRGPDSLGVYNYIRSIPKSRRVLIKGNHEDLYLELLSKTFPDKYDFSNHTVDTFCQIASYNTEDILQDYKAIKEAWPAIKEAVAKSPITKWLKSKEWKNYYELNDKFICVHSFIPTKLKDEYKKYLDFFGLGYNLPDEYFEYEPNWRNSDCDDWYEARWGCPWSQYKAGIFKPEENNGKTLICGHWHTADFMKYLGEQNADEFTDIFYSPGIIGIDGGVWLRNIGIGLNLSKIKYHPQNILVIKGTDCFDKLGNKLYNMLPQNSEDNKVSYWLAPGTNMDDRAVCYANCDVACARKDTKIEGIYTASDFSEVCSKFVKKD